MFLAAKTGTPQATPYRFKYTVFKSIHTHSDTAVQGFDPQTLFHPHPAVAFSFHKNDKLNT